jgi:hypothetical protein
MKRIVAALSYPLRSGSGQVVSRAIHDVRTELNRLFWERAGAGRFALRSAGIVAIFTFRRGHSVGAVSPTSRPC